MKIAVLQDKIKGVWRSLTTEELKDAADDDKPWIPNREARRAWFTRTRLKGSGYTRAFRKGREQRDQERPRRARGRGRPLTEEEDHRLRMEAMRLAALRSERAERRTT
jgi:hypothetical protein